MSWHYSQVHQNIIIRSSLAVLISIKEFRSLSGSSYSPMPISLCYFPGCPQSTNPLKEESIIICHLSKISILFFLNYMCYLSNYMVNSSTFLNNHPFWTFKQFYFDNETLKAYGERNKYKSSEHPQQIDWNLWYMSIGDVVMYETNTKS